MHRHSSRPGRWALWTGAMVAAALIPLAVASQPDSETTQPGVLSAEQILSRSDDFHFFYEDAHLEVRSVLKDKDGDVDELKMEVWEKGARRLIVFQSPPEVAGMAILVKDPQTIYVYEPEFNKVRRIASHAKKQSMFGSDISFDEMATKRLGLDYEPRILEEDPHHVVLELSARNPDEKAWPTLKVHVDKDAHFMAHKIEYLDDEGNRIKTEKRKKLEKAGGWLYPAVLTMVDHTRKHSTTNMVKNVSYNVGLPDTMFTKRHLIRED